MKGMKMMDKMPAFLKKKGASKPPGMKAKKYAKGGGIEIKGKTRGKMC
jgi:hypothetical protein